MASTINTNINSLTAQRNLATNAISLSTSIARLSSGLRVNSAKDDAAGLAIAERFNSQARGLAVGARNANDGISLAQTTEGALGKIGDSLQRIRELAVQAGNATNSKTDRAALQAEVKQLTDEVDRISKQTSFNGQRVLDGSFIGAAFQVGANAGNTITVGKITNSTAAGLAKVAYAYDQSASNVAASSVSTLTSIATATLTISITGGATIDLGPINAATTGQERLGQIVEAVNRKTADTGVTAYLTQNATGTYRVDLLSTNLDSAGDATVITKSAGFTTATTGLSGGVLASNINSTNTTTDALGIDTLTVDTQRNAFVALLKVDAAITQVNSARADLGALQSRFESTVGNIDISIENISAARGRIVDADFAKETANLSRSQILQQAGTAIVAQANQLPQGVLALLR